MIQIDGLSKTQFERALDEQRMPFVKSLIQKESYQCHQLYSGLPSSTPAVQGELYYGAKTVVPAFGFRDHHSGRLVRMFANEIAKDVEDRMQTNGEGLLKGGSSYCNIYAGGAEDVHFCSTSFGWSEFFDTVNPLRILVVFLLNAFMVLRIIGLMVLELVFATIDFVRGVLSGRRFWQELIMIPARVVVVVLLRELVTLGACYDAARGRPIIHLNLLGYDEQAHRRGPGSRFAHWSLGGIDSSIRRIWKAAHRGAGREYDVWVFSDHGQEATQPYQLAHGKPIQQVIAEMVDDGRVDPMPKDQSERTPRLQSRANWLGIDWLVSMLFGEQDHDIQTRSKRVQTVTSGPLGFVYFLNDDLKQDREKFAKQLVEDHKIPMAIIISDEKAIAFLPKGRFELPGDAVQIFGADHPFLTDIADDIIDLASHADAGDILLVGWLRPPKNVFSDGMPTQSTSFVLQNGAHAGPGAEETNAFALMPSDIHLDDNGKGYLRPNDLRIAALRFLGRELPDQKHPDEKIVEETQRNQLVSPPLSRSAKRASILTYNVHGCVGMDGLLSPERIARVIGQSGAMIVCLQELDMLRQRSGKIDQAHAIAECLEMQFEFNAAWHLEEESFGNAILTPYPMSVIERRGLHHHRADRSRRSAMWVEIDIGNGTFIQVINTHLSIYPKEQLIQANELVEEWIQPASLKGPVILCGDFNARPKSATCQSFNSILTNGESFDANPTRATYFSPLPMTRVDHIFVSKQFESVRTQVINTRLAKIASDHLPLLGEAQIRSARQTPDTETSDSLISNSNS